MNEKNPEDKFSARLNVKCHPSLVRAIRAIAKKSDINTSMLVRMWLNDCVDNASAKGGKVGRG